MSKIGIFGGTFNPVHKGHIMLAQYCKNELELDRIILVPTYTPPHKASSDLASAEHRLNMCKIACENLLGFEVSDIEIKLEGKSYTYRTLSLLKEMYPNDSLYFIMGADMFLSLHTWKNPDIIFEKAEIAAVPRNLSSRSELSDYYKNVLMSRGAKVIVLKNAVMQVSSTEVREKIENNLPVDDLTDSRVYDYIIRNNLYRK